MTGSASTSEVSYRQSLNQALHASSILTGAHDDELGIQRSTRSTKLGTQHQQENQDALNATLSDRVLHAIGACSELSSFQQHSDPQIATGDLALQLLSVIHTALIEKRKDVASRVAVQDERLPGLKHEGVQPTEDVGLGVKNVKLVTTLQSLASKWSLSTRIKAYDQSLFSLAPKGFPTAQGKSHSINLTPHNRFEEIDDDVDIEKRSRARAAFDTARTDLSVVVGRFMDMFSSPYSTPSTAGISSTPTDAVTVMLRVAIVDYLSSLLRLGFGPSISAATVTTGTPARDIVQKRAATATTQLLRFLSTHSAMSALSSVISHSDAKLGAPSFLKAVCSRLLSAQLLRTDGVRSLFIITFGGAESSELDGAGEGTGNAAPGTNTLKRFEQCSRLLLTPPQGMPIDVYLPIILPHLLNILAPDLSASSIVTPPPQEQMRAAGFVLTRISERYPELFSKSMHDRVYSKFRPSMQAALEAQKERPSAGSDSSSAIAVSATELDSAISTLSSFLLFSEPSPTFFAALFEPILPQLLTLYDYIYADESGTSTGKVRSLDSGGHADRLRTQVSNFLKTWFRLVDAEHGAQSLIQSVQTAEKGIGYAAAVSESQTDGEHGDFFWCEDSGGVSIRYGEGPDQGEEDISILLKNLSLAALAKQISTGDNDELDLTKLAPDLSAKLGLQPDPRLLATLLKGAERKDMARLLLPSVLNVYISIKTAPRVGIHGANDNTKPETRSVLYLQLILQLLQAFGSDLLQGDVPATLAFIDFSLTSPSQRQAPSQQQQQQQESDASDLLGESDMPFISAKPATSQSPVPSLFNVAGDHRDSKNALSGQDIETGEDTEAVEDDEDEEELVTTALSLLLSLLESDPLLSSETQPMLVVVADKIDSLLDSASSEIRSLAKEAKLVLMARRNSLRGGSSTLNAGAAAISETSATALAYVQAQETYQEALKLLQDPILPVRAHGLVLLRRLVSDDSKSGGQHVERVDPALVPAILDIFLHAVEDEESYLYLNAVQGLGALASSGGGQTISRLVGIYVGRDDGLASRGLAAREVEKRLRVGEALLQVIQRCGDAMVAHVDDVAPPLLVRLRDRALPNVLRSSFISILGTVVEAAPVAMARKGYAGQLAEVCIDIVVIEMVQRPNAPSKGAVKLNVQGKRVTDPDADDEDKEKQRAEQQRKLDSATSSDAKVAHLRRAAMLLLTLLVRGMRYQLEEQNDSAVGSARLVEKLSALRLPGGGTLPSVAPLGDGDRRETESLQKKDLLFPPHLLERLKQVAAYVKAGDTDAIVRTHAHDCIEHVDALSLDLIQSGLLQTR